MKLDFLAKPAVLIKAKLTLAFCVHVYLVSVCDVILVFTDRANQSYNFARPFFSHTWRIVA